MLDEVESGGRVFESESSMEDAKILMHDGLKNKDIEWEPLKRTRRTSTHRYHKNLGTRIRTE